MVAAAFTGPFYFFVWRDYDGDDLRIRSFDEELDTFGSETVIPNTNSNSLHPSLAPDTNTKLHLVWEESGAIYYTKINHSGGGNYTFSPSKESVSSGTGYSDHTFPSVITDYSRRPNVTWQAFEGVTFGQNIIVHRRRELSDEWSSATSFIGNQDYFKPSIMGFPNVPDNQNLRATWRRGNDLIWVAKYDGSAWDDFWQGVNGQDPTSVPI